MPTIFLGGDLMTGRGVDQILAHPGDPRLWEPATRDARSYVRLAEEHSNAVPRPAADAWPWGDALELLDRYGAQVRVANLETSITTHDDAAPGKGVHYRMAPGNVGCLRAGRLDAVCVANNHVLDFGRPGLVETLETLETVGIATAGAGRDADEAARPAIVPAAVSADGAGRVVLFGLASPSSGVPPEWTATGERPGVQLVSDLTPAAADELLDRVAAVRRPGDTVVVSVHWGSNWGYEVPAEQITFAHRLIEGGVDIVHGHSSHHPRPVELHDGRLILYGVGDLIDDYEGIGGYEQFRPELRLLPIATVDAASGRLTALQLIPVRSRQMRLQQADPGDAEHLRRTLNDISDAPLFQVTGEGVLELGPR
jgi:poly-gamma-glutamate capsule biosynthesis protein CapA/YwtB (metallophosphatase superfamily)